MFGHDAVAIGTCSFWELIMRALAGIVYELACNVGVTDSGVSPRSLRVRWS